MLTEHVCQFPRHNYGDYTRGDRCLLARQAKADYMRERRAAARSTAQWGVKLEGIVHGRYGYEELGCRCMLCRWAHG